MPTRLFTVHLSLISTMRDRRGRAYERSTRKRLVLIADHESDARDRALTWLRQTWEGPTGKISFGSGRVDAVDVRLASGTDAVWVHEELADVVELS